MSNIQFRIELHVRGKLKQCLTEWCADDVKKAFDKDEEVHLNLQIFALKDLHANWMIKICSEMDKKKDLKCNKNIYPVLTKRNIIAANITVFIVSR